MPLRETQREARGTKSTVHLGDMSLRAVTDGTEIYRGQRAPPVTPAVPGTPQSVCRYRSAVFRMTGSGQIGKELASSLSS